STWLLTGDLGVITGGGLVRVEGRADDVIVTGGLSVAPGQVLSALLSAPGIADAWVTSTPDDKWGELVTAIVVPAQMPTSPEQMAGLGRAIRDHVGSRIGRAYAPRRVVAADALPSLNGVKIDRIGARRIAEDEDRPERDWRR
ncbi:MAG: acyl-CoA synthetase, partial [Schaalia hyovaginalis]|nr:acyl-CoA synthetase [Schaalia hyovaginalis]